MYNSAIRLNAAIITFQRWSAVLSSFLLAAMMIIGTIDVVSLNLAGYPIPVATEIASALLPPCVFLAMARAQHLNAHIRVDLFDSLFSPRIMRITSKLALVAACLVFAGLSYGSLLLANKSFLLDERAVAAIQFPIWPSKIGFAIGAVLALIESARQLILALTWAEQDDLHSRTHHG